MASKKKSGETIRLIMEDGSLESVTVQQPRLTANFLLQRSSLAQVGNVEGFVIGQVFLFAAEFRRPNGEKLFEDFEEAAEKLHFSANEIVFKMIDENEDMKEIIDQSGGHKTAAPEGELDDPK